MTDEEQKDWEDFIVWLDSEDAYKVCFDSDSDTAHAIRMVAKELKERREDEEWLMKNHYNTRIHIHPKAFTIDHDYQPCVPHETLHAAITAARGK